MDRYQALMVDLYDAQAQGPVRDSVEFYNGCRRALCDVGVMAVNLFGNHGSFGPNLENIRQAFGGRVLVLPEVDERSEEHTSELQSLMRISYAVFCLKKKIETIQYTKNK